MDRMNLNELAVHVGKTRDSVRHWRAKGLIPDEAIDDTQPQRKYITAEIDKLMEAGILPPPDRRGCHPKHGPGVKKKDKPVKVKSVPADERPMWVQEVASALQDLQDTARHQGLAIQTVKFIRYGDGFGVWNFRLFAPSDSPNTVEEEDNDEET